MAVKREIRVRGTHEEPGLILSRGIDQEILVRLDLLIAREAPLLEIVLSVRERVAIQRYGLRTGIVNLDDVRNVTIFVLIRFRFVATLIGYGDGDDLANRELGLG